MATAKTGTLIDLFCGCGGFSLGAELAGFRSLAAVDVDPTLQSAYRRNFPGSRAIQASVSELEAGDWRQIIGPVRPDLVIGGPPCQGFSAIGKRDESDPRNGLVQDFYRQVRILRPRIFVMENVEGILREGNRAILNRGIDSVSDIYEIVGPVVVDASHVGAATTRRRVVVIGYDRDAANPVTEAMFAPRPPHTLTTVRDAISDLPSPVPEVKNDWEWGAYDNSATPSSYATAMRRLPPPGLGWGEAVEKLRQGLVTGIAATRHQPSIAERYAGITAGKSDPITKSYKLAWEKQCPTLRAGTGADKGAFQAVRPLHPSEGRVITVREAARLQGFPDWFTFHQTKWHSFRMIGNSVSPIVSTAIMTSIAENLNVALAA